MCASENFRIIKILRWAIIYLLLFFFSTERRKMNEVKTRVVDGTNCSKQLKFGVERILSDEISTKKTGKNIGNIYLTRSSIIFSIFVDQFDSKKKKERKQNKTKVKTKSTILWSNICVSKDILRPLPIQFSMVRCPCPGSCVRCEALRICPSFPYVQTSISGSYGSTNHGNIENYTNIYRPAPLRPVPRGEN